MTYTPDAPDHYDAIATPGSFDVLVRSADTVGVTVNGTAATMIRQGNLHRALGGLTSGLVTEGLEAATGDCFNPENVIASTVGGAIVGAVGGKIDINAEINVGNTINSVRVAGERVLSAIAGGSLASIGNSLGNGSMELQRDGESTCGSN